MLLGVDVGLGVELGALGVGAVGAGAVVAGAVVVRTVVAAAVAEGATVGEALGPTSTVPDIDGPWTPHT